MSDNFIMSEALEGDIFIDRPNKLLRSLSGEEGERGMALWMGVEPTERQVGAPEKQALYHSSS